MGFDFILLLLLSYLTVSLPCFILYPMIVRAIFDETILRSGVSYEVWNDVSATLMEPQPGIFHIHTISTVYHSS